MQNSYTHKIRQYPDGIITLVEYDTPIVIGSKYEDIYYHEVDSKDSRVPDTEYAKEQRSLRRAKDMMYQYLHSNQFDIFVTGTFDPQKIDRENEDLVRKTITKYIDNDIRRHDKTAKYILVPEYHERGNSCLHWHALIKSDYLKTKLVDSGKRTKHGQIIFNLGNYKWGFSTAIIIGDTPVDSAKVANYVMKYMKKGMVNEKRKKGKKRYWISNNLDLPTTLKLNEDKATSMLLRVGAQIISSKEIYNPYTDSYDRHYILNYTPSECNDQQIKTQK